jgi:hypothetical protein
VQVAVSMGATPGSGFGPFALLSIRGYNPAHAGNIYLAAVNPCPFGIDDMLLGLFATNLGNASRDAELRGNSDGVSFIGLALSCDGTEWSSLIPIAGTTGRDGRTQDHPVDGLLHEGSMVSVLIHRDVYGIAPREAWPMSRLVRRALHRQPLTRLAASARKALGASCSSHAIAAR